jgi:hypothetical protein
MLHLIPNDLTIPDFLKRDPAEIKPITVKRGRRTAKIAYPKDGYACKGLRADARDRHQARLRRRAERMRDRTTNRRRKK